MMKLSIKSLSAITLALTLPFLVACGEEDESASGIGERMDQLRQAHIDELNENNSDAEAICNKVQIIIDVLDKHGIDGFTLEPYVSLGGTWPYCRVSRNTLGNYEAVWEGDDVAEELAPLLTNEEIDRLLAPTKP